MRPRNKTYKRKSKKNKTYKRKSYKKRSYRKNPSRKNKKSKRIRKSRRSFIKKTRTNKSKGKRMVGGATSATLRPEVKQNAAEAFNYLRRATAPTMAPAELTMAQAVDLIRDEMGITDCPMPRQVVERVCGMIGCGFDAGETLHQKVKVICEELDIQTNWPNYKLNETHYSLDTTQPSG